MALYKAFAESQRDIGGRDRIETAVQVFNSVVLSCSEGADEDLS